jgi:Bacterial Ig domain
VTVTVTATDPEGGAITYSAIDGNQGVVDIDPLTGELTYTPDPEARGVFVVDSFVVTATTPRARSR